MIKNKLLAFLELSNPWVKNPGHTIFANSDYIQRIQFHQLIKPIWDDYITLLMGPRQSGKTTLGRYLCQKIINQGRYQTVLYLNSDEVLVREWLTGSHVLQDIQKFLNAERFILFIDETQRLENPGLFLKSIFDLKLPIKLIATGLSQSEMKNKVQKYFTERQLESIILPLSRPELRGLWNENTNTIFGCYPQIVITPEKQLILTSLYQNYINKYIIEILKIRNADTIQKLLSLMAHCSGQLVNYQQLAADCRVSSHTIQHYLSILENTYILSSVLPFVGNKRTEVTSNPIYYFIDNGFRNQALNNFSPLQNRTDIGLLIQSSLYQEFYKFKTQNYINIGIHYWRTKSGAEVDFVLYKNEEVFIPIEVKYRSLTSLTIERGFRSFLQAYHPKIGIIITKNIYGELMVEDCKVYFIPFSDIGKCLDILKSVFLIPM